MANGEWVRWFVQTTSTRPCLDKNFATPITWNTIPLCYHAVIITSSSKQYDFMSLFSLFSYVCVWQYETLTALWHTEVINNWSCMKQDVLGSSSSCNACLERSDCLPRANRSKILFGIWRLTYICLLAYKSHSKIGVIFINNINFLLYSVCSIDNSIFLFVRKDCK